MTRSNPDVSPSEARSGERETGGWDDGPLIHALRGTLQERRRPTPVATWSGLLGLGIDGLGQDIEHFRHVWVLVGVADAQRRDRENSS
jgi:hypothetical protein